MSQSYNYPYDPTGKQLENLVKDFPITLDRTSTRAFALTGPFYGKSLKVRNKNNQTIELKEHLDYRLLYIHEELFDTIDSPVFSIVHFHNLDNNGPFLADFQLLGGNRQGNASIIQQMISNIKNDSSDVYLESIIDFPSVLPPEGHLHHISNTYGYENAIDIFRQILAYLRAADNDLGLNITNQINGINDKYNQLLVLIEDLDADLGDSSGLINGLITDLSEKVNDLEQRVIALENGLSNFINSTTLNLNKLSGEILTNKTEHERFVSETNNRLTSIDNTIAVHTQSLQSINNQLSNVANNIVQINQTLTDHQEQINALKNRAENLETKDIQLQQNINDLINHGETTATLLTAATTLATNKNKHVVQHNGPFILPVITNVEDGHVMTFYIQSGTAPQFVVNDPSTERMFWNGTYDTSLKVEDKYCITLVRIAHKTWGIYL